MALIHWEPFREMDLLRRQMDRVFDELAQASRDPSGVPQSAQAAWVPAVELQDTDAGFILRAELPGLAAKDLDIQVTREAVSLSGEHRYERQSEDQGFFRSEFRYGRFQRIVPLPAQVQNDQVTADLKDGILTLTLPKVETERRVFKVNLAEKPAATLEAGNGQTGSEAAQNVDTASLMQ